MKTHWERILNVCKSSWLTCIEVKWDVDIYYRPIAAKFTPQILRPEHRKYKYDLTDHHEQLPNIIIITIITLTSYNSWASSWWGLKRQFTPKLWDSFDLLPADLSHLVIDAYCCSEFIFALQIVVFSTLILCFGVKCLFIIYTILFNMQFKVKSTNKPVTVKRILCIVASFRLDSCQMFKYNLTAIQTNYFQVHGSKLAI